MKILRLFLFGFVIASPVLFIVVRAGEAPKGRGDSIADFTLNNAGGSAVSLSQFKDKKAVVVLFLGTECPINNYFAPRLVELHKEFADQSVQFLGINSNRQDTAAEIAAHAKKYALPFPVLRDEHNVIADRFGAQRTPEAFVLDAERRIRYQGRIDDQYGIDIQRAKPTRRDLAEAIKEVLTGKEVAVRETKVAGCLIGRDSKTKADGAITFAKHVAPIFQKHCQECHRPGQIGPMALLSYDDAVSWAGMIHEVVSDGRMPPWHADPRFGKFLNDRSLPKHDRETLLAWIDQGMPRGQEKDDPPPRQFPQDWKIGKPDVIIHMPVEFDVPAQMPKNGVPYKHYTVQTDFDEDKWVERAEAKAGAPEVVHHMLVFIVPPGVRFVPGSPETPVLTGMAPGEQPFLLKPGVAKLIPKGSRLLFQMHYTPNGKAQKDRSSIGLVFAKAPPKIKVNTQPVFNLFFRIPAGADNYQVEATHTFAQDGYILGMMPHMHLRGKDFKIQAIYPDKREETLLYVPRFNFNWQVVFRPEPPLVMPKGTRIHCVAHFDNSKSNPNNPNPQAAVTWGDQTWQEMMIGWFDFAYDHKEEGK